MSYILDTSLLSDTHFAKMFSLSAGWSSPFLDDVLCSTEVFNFNEVRLSIVSLITHGFTIVSWKTEPKPMSESFIVSL